MALVITAQFSIAPGGSLRRTAGTPAWWLRSCRTVTDSLPPADRGPRLATGGEVLGESCADRLEAGVTGPADHGLASRAAT
jgi:hypothetical protein